MKYIWLGTLLFAGLLFGGNQDSEFNVNSRYTVETVYISGTGWTTNVAAASTQDERLSSELRKEIAALIGEKLNPTMLDDLAKRIRREFHARTVEHHVLRGKSPDYVQVVFDIQLRPTRFDISVPKFLYNSKQTWSGAVEGTTTIGHNGVTFGLVSDGDELAERYTGLVARYENNKVGTDRIHFRFQFESYHDQWDENTRNSPALNGTSGIYRARQSYEPEVTLTLAKPLTLSVGTSFQQFENEEPAGQVQAANAFTTTLRYHRRLEASDFQHDLDAAYGLRGATRLLGSDFVYARQHWGLRYMMTHGKSVVIDDLAAGVISGRAPLFERFMLGNSTTLRGWNKYELDPAGGNRVAHNSVEYRYGAFQAFYDAGAVWDRSEAAVLRHSVGVGLRQGVFSMAAAFPLREGHIEPIFILGMNY